jgi:acetyl-CoA synthetase
VDLVSPAVRRVLSEAAEDPESFWAVAAERLPWFRRWDRVFEWDFPTFRWFLGGQTNLGRNALDHHVAKGRSGRAALVYANERGERRVFTYAQLFHMVGRVSASLRAMGIGKGDRVAVYMPTCPEAIMVMLSAARIGAIHIVVFAGFGAGALAQRIRASGARVLFTADATYRKGSDVPLIPIVQRAMSDGLDTVEAVVILNRRGDGAEEVGDPERTISWQEFLDRGTSASGEAVPVESNEPAFILATSGTTATPKLAVHTHGGYQVFIHSMGRWCFGLSEGDVWWSTSDVGWVVGHSYIVYAPLLAGCTTVAYEGALDYPGPEAVWRLVEEFGITGMFTSPTAVRLLMRYGTDVARGPDVSSLRRVFCAGEVLNPPAWEWLQREVLRDRVPVIDHMWQTETGGPVFGNPYGISMLPIKPGSAGIALPGIEAAVVTETGEPCPPDQKGIMVVKRPFPGLTATLWGESERYGQDYWQRIPGVYTMGDSAHMDEDGYVWFAGRADEIIKIADHRIGTIEVETAFLKHRAVAEAGVIGKPDELRGQVISAFVVLRQGGQPSEELRGALIDTVREELGTVAVISDIHFVRMLPKTRSGKIMRRVLKAVVMNEDPGDITTIEDAASVEEARQAWVALREQAAGGAERTDVRPR